MTKPSPAESNLWKATRRLRPRDIRDMSQTHLGPRSGQSCPGTWVHTIWIQEDEPTRHVEAHVLSA
jgi:hypothetical protein